MVSKTIVRTGVVSLLGLMLVGPINSFAATATTTYAHASTKDVFVTELQTGSNGGSGQEFIELYNNTGSDIDFADAAHSGKDAWKLQYFSKSKLTSLLSTANWSSPYRTIGLTGVIPAHDYYVLAGSDYAPGNIEPDQTYSSTLSDDGGGLQLIDSTINGSVTTVTVHDQLAWSNDKPLAVNPLLYTAPGTTASLQRLPNADTEYVGDDNMLTTFIVSDPISPESAWMPPIVVPTVPDPSTGQDPTDGSNPTPPLVPHNQGLATPIITELLPNPAAPQTDEQNEYIELYNPNDVGFNLNGYTLETGQTSLHDFTFTSDTILLPHSYETFYASETGLSLSNSGGQARLLDPNKATLDQTDAYGTAADGQAWALSEQDSTWHWTATPTAGALNIISTPPATAKKTVVTKTTSTKVKSKKVTGIKTVKKKKAKVTKPKKAKKAKKITQAKLASASTVAAPAPIHPVVLAGVAVLAVGYGVYEYRTDLANAYHKRRTDRAARRKARS